MQAEESEDGSEEADGQCKYNHRYGQGEPERVNSVLNL
jgi:hypothetical protein